MPTSKAYSLAALLVAIAACSRASPSPSPSHQDLGQGISSAIASLLAPPPRVIVDEDISIAAHMWESRSFTLPTAHPVELVVEGEKNSQKGFAVHVMPTSDLEPFKKNEAYQPLPAFEGVKVHSLSHTDTLSNGSWTVIVRNSENLRKPLVVHVRIVLDPA